MHINIHTVMLIFLTYTQDLDDGYRCDCNTGYTGVNCSDEINECDGKPCGDNGDCIVSYIYIYSQLCTYTSIIIGWTR